MNFFEALDRDIAVLDDVHFKELLRRLLEAEAQARGISASGITAGGDQNAADGGADATIAWVGSPDPTGWLPRRTVAFQAKAERMPPSRVTPEMRPHGRPRPLLADLANTAGAYIIFAKESCANGPLMSRLAAMRAAVYDVQNGADLELDFYDTDKIARWANAHPGVAGWLLERAGRSLGGWQPHRNWSGAQTPYLIDDRPRAFLADGTKLTTIDAIDQVRHWLAPGGVVRLVGLSGMGKTRFAEALFDPSTGERALPAALAVYGDLSDDLAVRPGVAADRLRLSGQRSVMIVDNCPSGAHRELAKVVRASGGKVGLLTIDFDVGDDQPEDTHVLRLGENSDETIDRLLRTRHPWLHFLDRERMIKFADGNARVALATAANSGGGSVARLSDRQLIERLFHTARRQHDPMLQRCAEAAALVYAFYVEPPEGDEAERETLARLAGVTSGDFYRAIRDLVERGVAQQRGPQRAVLPQALAIHLAKLAYDGIPPTDVVRAFLAGPSRLFLSFTRRLGMLHDSSAGRLAAELLLSPNGRLDLSGRLAEPDIQAFANVAPAAPAAALTALERALGGTMRDELVGMENAQRSTIAFVAIRLAYPTADFGRAVRTHLAFVLAEPRDHKHNATRPMLDRLFWAVASGTQAPPAVRLAFLDTLKASQDERERTVAEHLLGEMLKTDGFSFSSGEGAFGTHARGDEWRPDSAAKLAEWFEPVIGRVAAAAAESDAAAERARDLLVKHFRGLVLAGQVKPLAVAVGQVTAAGHYWAAAWRAVCKSMYFDGASLSDDVSRLLAHLEAQLRPVSLVQRFEAFVLEESRAVYHPMRRSGRGYRNAGYLARAVGKAAAGDRVVGLALAQRAIIAEVAHNAFAFGKGFAAASANLAADWHALRDLYATADEAARSSQVLSGFLASGRQRDPLLVDCWLDAALVDPVLAPTFLDLALDGPVDGPSMGRIIRSLAIGRVPVSRYINLSHGLVVSRIPPGDLARLLTTLAALGGDGVRAAVEVLHMRIHKDRTNESAVAAELVAVGRELLANPEVYAAEASRLDWELALIARGVLTGEGARDAAAAACRALVTASGTHYRASYSFDQLATQIRVLWPGAFAEEVLVDDATANLLAKQFFGPALAGDEVETAEAAPADADILAWVLEAPEIRAPRLANQVPFVQADSNGNVTWTPIAAALIDMPDVAVPVLEQFEHRFGLGSWSGSTANRFIRRRGLLVALSQHDDTAVRAWATAAAGRLEHAIERDLELDRRTEELFEAG
jgi:hypothetical protein